VRGKLIVLNLALAFAAIYAGLRVRSQWLQARQEEKAVLSKKAPAPAQQPLSALPPTHPVLPSGYIDVAQKMLFDKSRNATVVIEKPAPPAPVPDPPLPAYHGQMNLGDGPMVIMSEGSGPHKPIRRGEMIGAYKLVDVTRTELALEWSGKVIRKKVEELVDRGGSPSQAPAQPAQARAAPQPPPPTKLMGPGQDTGAGFRACSPLDGYPNGAVVDGYRRVNTETPFGIRCRWEPAR
jgi:hypothetical protein